MFRRNFVTLTAYSRKEESFKINYQCFHLKNLEKESKLNLG